MSVRRFQKYIASALFIVGLSSLGTSTIFADTYGGCAYNNGVYATGSGCGASASTPPAVTAFTASPATITSGSSSLLQWSVTNASSTSIDQGVGVVGGSSVAVSPTTTTAYIITATNPQGTATSSITVTVSPLVTGADTTASPLNSGGGGGGTISGPLSPTNSDSNSSVNTDGGAAAVPSPGSATVLTRDLAVGSEGNDVRQLQQFLKDQGFYTHPVTTGIYGPLTKQAVADFQLANGIEPLGGVGPQTRAKINQALASLTPPAASSFTRNLYMGIEGNDVNALQKYLNKAGFIIAATGVGSPGNETNYFGNRTRDALIDFQEAHFDEILAPAGLTRGNGFFGPNTRAYITSHPI